MNINVFKPISRRTVLRGLSAAIALPWLEAMTPLGKSASAAGEFPVRMGFLYVPNGVHMPEWTPKEEGTGFSIGKVLEPIKAFQNDFCVLTGLAQHNAFDLGDGPGDHARSLACFLTGTHPVKTDGANIKNGVSVDQVAAQKLGGATRLPSLELGCERGAQAGGCDSGYSFAYSSNISWRSPTSPVAKEVNPRLVFERLFGVKGDGPEGVRRRRLQRSILDFVAEDAKSLNVRLSGNDRRKVDEYLTSVREIEARIARTEKPVKLPNPKLHAPSGIPKDFPDHIKLMLDLMVLSFQTDVTRISTFMYVNEGNNRGYSEIGVSEGHHDLSHHGHDQSKQEKITKINIFHITQFAYMLERMKSIKEGDGTLLDHSMIVYGSGISDGDRHNHDDLPVLLAGKAKGAFTSGRHVRYPNNTPLNNLFLSMLDVFGAPIDSLGDSTGRLTKLKA